MRRGIQLCYPYSEKRFESWGSKAILQPKLNGERCRVVFDEQGKVHLLSSEENERPSVPHINEALESYHLKNVEFDGELYVHGMDLERIHSIVSQKNQLHPGYKTMELHLFDVVNGDNQLTRIKVLNSIIKTRGPLRVVDSKVVYSLDDLSTELDRYYELNYEGIVLRKVDSLYVRKRSTGVMKLKPTRSDSYIIRGYKEECDIRGVPKGTLGAIILQGDDETLFGVGTGPYLTDEHRKALWQEKEKLIGKIAYIKYKSLTGTGKVPKEASLLNIYESKK